MCSQNLFVFLLGMTLFNTISCAVELKEKDKLEKPPAVTTPAQTSEPMKSTEKESFEVKFQIKLQKNIGELNIRLLFFRSNHSKNNINHQ